MDRPLAAVVAELTRLDPDGARTGQVIRNTFDQLYDGGHTGRYRWDQLFKTEKTHFGTLVEINLQREFRFPDGQRLDFCIVGHEVDAKYSQSMWGWMLPPEAVGQLCMVITASDELARYSLGAVRATLEVLSTGANRDAKRTLSKRGHDAVAWVHDACELPPNVLLQMDETDVREILAERSGQRRINELFRRAVGRSITRIAVETVAQQRDPMKRVRGNGGAREHLGPEGIAIFGGDYAWQRDAAAALGLPVPGEGEFVSTYLKRADSEPGMRNIVTIGDVPWTVATAADSTTIPVAFYG